MKRFYFSLLLFALITLSVSQRTVIAQSIRSQTYDSTIDKSEWRIGLRYTSDYYYMGRADSAAAPYLSPSIGYYHTSGFFLRSSLSYLTASGEGRIDLYTLSGGYDFFGKKVTAGVSVYEYFFNDLSYAIPAEMSTYLNAYAGYDFTAFMVYADVGLGISEGKDLFLGAEINRTFYALKNRLRITPAIYVNAGSQNYYSEYYSMRSTQTGSGKGKGYGGNGQYSSTMQSMRIVEADKFQLLDYEADIQISYKVGNVRFYVSTTWTFPINPATVVADTGTYEEELKNGFYWSSVIRLTL
jgi:hypothetical protein